jgi:PAS domain-containing protein
MSDQHLDAIELERLADLRKRAASRLAGPAASLGSTARAADALGVLHALASSPETASDALTLLHELQVHQVELDLQAQELRDSRAELETALRRQIELYDHMPVGCFTIDLRMALHELNQTGLAMLGITRDEAYGLPLDAFFCAESARRFRSAMSGLEAGTRPSSLLIKLCPRNGPERQVLASIVADPAALRYLVSLTDAGEEA